ncbi:MAG: NAD-dependent succinate-semialdehyde dehydrogenase [Brumimicrobium sp.]|nr:NAD-dependent succinate-semialdehyde dehydrogenase [Brumimicrobium sp.]
MVFKSINPYTDKEIAQYEEHSKDEIHKILENSSRAFSEWRSKPLSYRTNLLSKAGKVLKANVDEYADCITREMGKPITETRAEVEKCAWVCEYYAENAEDFLQTKSIETDADKSMVRYDPIGPVLAIMPWNFPFWQVFRFAAPTLTAGNTGLLKHASNVLGCAQKIEEVFLKAGFPEGVFQNIIVHHEKIESILENSVVKAVTLTGSEKAGSSVAGLAGKNIKKSVLELGGSNAFIVWKDADLEQALETAVNARMMNTGQSCIAAKRFLIMEDIYDEFLSGFTERISKLKQGDPLDKTTKLGPLARKDLADQLSKQVEESVQKGAKLTLGGGQNGCMYEATVLENVKPGMPAFDEETFGPVAAFTKVKTIEEAFELSNHSKFGLGVSLFTQNTEKALGLADRVEDGALFINDLVKSDPRLPFGGTKYSGYGRELSKDGIMEFVNKKTVYVKK